MKERVMASNSWSPHEKTRIPRPERQGMANRILPKLGTLIKHGVFVPSDKFVYHEYRCKISQNERRLSVSLHECPWLQERLKCLDDARCPTIKYLPSKEAPTELLMSPSAFKLVADWAREGYKEDYEWKRCPGAWHCKHLIVRTMGRRAVREGVALGDVRNFFIEDVGWHHGIGKTTCKAKVTCRKHFVRADFPESDFSRLVHFLLDTGDEDNSEEKDEDEDWQCDVLTRIPGNGECIGLSSQLNSLAPITPASHRLDDDSDGEYEDDC